MMQSGGQPNTAELPGVSDVWTLLEFLGDSKRYAKALKVIEAKIKESRALIKLVGKAEDIQVLRDEAEKVLEKVGNELLAAKNDAGRIVEDAKQAADERANALEQREERLTDGENDFLGRCVHLKKEEKAFTARSAELDRRLADAKKDEEVAAEKAKTLKAKLAAVQKAAA